MQKQIVTNVKIYDLEECIKASKYPMAINTESVDNSLTDTVVKLGGSATNSAHGNFRTGIRVSFDVTFTNKVWVEAERYNFFDIVSSQSTMHRITKFNLDEAYSEYTDRRAINIMKELVKEYNECPTPDNYLRVLYSNPAGMYLPARISTNYMQLANIYTQRENHRIPEWREFCKWIKTLPYAKEFITGGS
jgi:hypothetical protein